MEMELVPPRISTIPVNILVVLLGSASSKLLEGFGSKKCGESTCKLAGWRGGC